MKKIAGLLIAASMLSMVACGPSEEEKKKADEVTRKQSSATADSLIQAMHDDDVKNGKADTVKKVAPADTTKHK
jgi:hypothetical protein